MLREAGHFLRHAPGVLRLKAKLPQPELYQVLMDRMDAAGLGERRAALVRDLTGDVLEIGSGTGSMFAHYPAGARVTALEPDAQFAEPSRARAAAAAAEVTVVEGRGEALPFPDASFDAVVMCLVLCSVDAVDALLAEVRRVLRPGGRVRLIEHVRSEGKVAGWLMDRIDGTWLKLNAQGCHLNRDPLPAIAAAGFELTTVEPFQVFSAGIPAFPMRWIEARRT